MTLLQRQTIKLDFPFFSLPDKQSKCSNFALLKFISNSIDVNSIIKTLKHFRNVTCISFKPKPLSYFSLKSSHFIHLFCRNFSYFDNLKACNCCPSTCFDYVIDPGFSKEFLPSDFFYTLFASIPFLISSDNGFYWEKMERETSYLHYPITIKNFLDIFRWNMAHKEVLVNMKRKQKCLNVSE